MPGQQDHSFKATKGEKGPNDGIFLFNLPILKLLEEIMGLPANSGVVQETTSSPGFSAAGFRSIPLGMSPLAA